MDEKNFLYVWDKGCLYVWDTDCLSFFSVCKLTKKNIIPGNVSLLII